jgi:hypothetical protein
LNESNLEFDANGNLLNDKNSLKSWQGFSCKYFDGKNHIIRGLNTSVGFIKKSSSVENLSLVNSYFNTSASNNYSGGVVNNCIFVNNCHFEGVISSCVNGPSVGGIVGYCQNYGANIKNCSFKGIITSHNGGNYIGGILGGAYPGAVIENCVNWGKIYSFRNFKDSGRGDPEVAGIGAHCDDCYFYDCINYGDIVVEIKQEELVAGISSKGNVYNSINYGDIASFLDLHEESFCGGIVAYGIAADCTNYGNVVASLHVGGIAGRGNSTECFNFGNVTGTKYVGGLVGYNIGTITNSTNYAEVSGENYVGGVVGYTGGVVMSSNNLGCVSGIENKGAVVGHINIFNDNAKISNCFYLKCDSINTEINGIGNFEDAAGVCEAKNEDFFEQE